MQEFSILDKIIIVLIGVIVVISLSFIFLGSDSDPTLATTEATTEFRITTTDITTEVTTEATTEEITTTEATEESVNKISLGTFVCTAYCPCMSCCGKTDGVTATGAIAEAGWTIGVNPSVIPYGTKVEINGVVYQAEDTGNLGPNHIDIFFDTHEEALNYGVQYHEVFLVEEAN